MLRLKTLTGGGIVLLSAAVNRGLLAPQIRSLFSLLDLRGTKRMQFANKRCNAICSLTKLLALD